MAVKSEHIDDMVLTKVVASARTNNIIQGRGTGLMRIARERGMIRVYTVVGSAKSNEHGKLIQSSVTPDTILAAAQKMLHPYTLTHKKCE